LVVKFPVTADIAGAVLEINAKMASKDE
jgi:hypothetical protein